MHSQMVASGSAKAEEMVASRRQGAAAVHEYKLHRSNFTVFTEGAVIISLVHAARVEFQHYLPALASAYTAASCRASDGNVKRAADVCFYHVAKSEYLQYQPEPCRAAFFTHTTVLCRAGKYQRAGRGYNAAAKREFAFTAASGSDLGDATQVDLQKVFVQEAALRSVNGYAVVALTLFLAKCVLPFPLCRNPPGDPPEDRSGPLHSP